MHTRGPHLLYTTLGQVFCRGQRSAVDPVALALEWIRRELHATSCISLVVDTPVDLGALDIVLGECDGWQIATHGAYRRCLGLADHAAEDALCGLSCQEGF